jgi:tetratricopeptide (TPR) repeat protein
MEGKEVDVIVEELLSEIDDALIIIPNIEKAHQKEKERAYAAALEEYIGASFLAPNNRYLQRHIAKTYAAIGDLKNSAKYWEKILAQEEYSSHYLRYAHVLAQMRSNKKAKECFEKAYLLDKQNAKILIEWGDLLAIEGKYEDAIKNFEMALKLEVNDRDQIWLRLAEVNLEKDNTDEAMSLIKLVLDRSPDNQDARRLILKVLKKGER